MSRKPPTFQVCAGNDQPTVRLAPGVRLRREHFGGIVFDTRTGLTLDVDRAAFRWLETAREHGVTPTGADDAENRLLAQLLRRNVLLVAPLTEATPTPLSAPASWPAGPALTAPEIIHWAITYNCATHCPDCYARRCRTHAGTELDTRDAMRLVDRLAAWGVLQVAIGGGEPLLRSDLAEIAACAHERGIVVHVTTAYRHLTSPMLAQLAHSVTTLQIGIQTERLLADTEAEVAWLADTINRVRQAGLLTGANMMLSRTILAHFDQLFDALHRAGFTRLTLLRYKPPPVVARWRQEAPSPDEIYAGIQRLPALLAHVPEMSVRLDCALSFVQRHIPPAHALAAGVRGCVAVDRILALTPDGGMYPCSQLIHPRFRAGDILDDDAQEVWTTASILRRCRDFRAAQVYRASHCGHCPAGAQCGGCRVFAHTGLDADPVCAEVPASAMDYPRWLAVAEPPERCIS